MLRELPRALPEGPGRARERSKSSPGAPKNAPRALRASEEHSESLKLLQERSGVAATLENFDSSLHFFGASCQLATFLRRAPRLLSYIRYATLATPRSRHQAGYAKLGSLRHVGCATFATLRSPWALRYVRYAALASLCWLHYVHHATFATLRLLRYTLAALHSPRCVRYATFATLHWPRCVRYAAFATLRLLRYAGQTAFATLLSLRYICYATHSLRCVRHAAFATLCWIWKCAAIVQNDIVNKRSCEATGRRARHKQGQQSFVHGMHRSTLVYIYIYI